MGIVRHTYLPVVLPGITRGVARRHQNPGTNQLAPPPPLMRVGNQNMARTGPRQVGPPGPVQENMGNQAPTAGNGRGDGAPVNQLSSKTWLLRVREIWLPLSPGADPGIKQRGGGWRARREREPIMGVWGQRSGSRGRAPGQGVRGAKSP